MNETTATGTAQANTTPATGTAVVPPSTTPATTTPTTEAPKGSLLAQAKEPGATTEETKPAEGAETPKTDGDKPDDKKAEDKKPVVPEKYEFKMPEGVALDAKAVEAYSPVFKELGLSQEQAQKLVDLRVQEIKGMAAEYDRLQAEQLKTWETEIKAMPKSDEMLGYARRAVNKLVSGDDAKLFLESDIGSHPAVIRLLSKVGVMISEDRHPDGGAGNTTESFAQALYGDWEKKARQGRA